MKTQTMSSNLLLRTAVLALLMFAAAISFAQTPVDDDGNPVGTAIGNGDGDGDLDSGTLMSADELQALVGPIALYPDDLLAVVLPASTFPLEIVQAARFLEQLETNSNLKPDDSWDDSVVALLNYPEVVKLMNDDIDWTWRLGEAVVAQQNDVVAAVESFRDRAYAAGNLASDERQTVTRNDGAIEIDTVDDDVIYVPYYEPERVVIRQPRRAYYYYPQAYPVYYYPYPAGHHFSAGYFWGVTTAFQIGWASDYLHVQHYSYHGHPYFGWNYYDNYYWRRPSIQVFHNYYGNYSDRGYRDRHGDYWRPRHRGGARPGHYTARDRYYTDRRRSSSHDGYARQDRSDPERRRDNVVGQRRDPVARTNTRRADTVERRSDGSSRRSNPDTIRFRSRGEGGERGASDRGTSSRDQTARRNSTERNDTARRSGSERNDAAANRLLARQDGERTQTARGSANRNDAREQRTNSAGDTIRFRSRESADRSNRRAAESNSTPDRRSAPVTRSAPVSRAAPVSRSAPVTRTNRSTSQRSTPRIETSPRRDATPRPSPTRAEPTRRASPDRTSSSRATPQRSSEATPQRRSSSKSERKSGGERRRDRNR